MPSRQPDLSIHQAPWYASRLNWRYWLVLLLVPSALAALIIRFVPFSQPMPLFFQQAQNLIDTGHVSSTFVASGYSLFAAAGLKLGGVLGLECLQGSVYVALAAAIWLCLQRMSVPDKRALIATLGVVAYPDLLITVAKSWDVDLSSLLFLLTFWAALVVITSGATVARTTLLGCIWGVGMSVRPNLLLLFPALVFAIAKAPSLSSTKTKSWTRRMAISSLCLVVGGGSLAAINTGIHGSFYWPENGPYNLYQGHNPYTIESLRTSLTGEALVERALHAEGVDYSKVDLGSASMRSFFTAHSVAFARTHPGQEVEIALLKFVTVLRPDTKTHRVLSPFGVVKSFLALPVPVWIFSLVWWRRYKWDSIDWLAIGFAIFYLLPFVIVIADPRYRVPLDLLALMHTVHVWSRHPRSGKEKGTRQLVRLPEEATS